MSEKTAIVLFNLGGPDCPQSVRPFLRNLFADKAIIGLPNPFRFILAEIISRSREKEAQSNYAFMGGKSPIVEESQKQAAGVEKYLDEIGLPGEIKCFIAMRYWAPRISQVKKEIKAWGATKIILLPLYPHFSTTTTGSFFDEWDKVAKDLPKPVKVIDYFDNQDLITAHVKAILAFYKKHGSPKNTRLIMSAHGLPEKIIRAGDPYQSQIEKTCAAIAAQMPDALSDMQIAYQSKVGPLKWIGPSTLDELERAGKDGKSVLLVPIAFVSEHIETLVELDIEYKEEAEPFGITNYMRVPALGIAPDYIACLGKLAKSAMEQS